MITAASVGILLLKVTVVFAGTLVLMPLLKHASAALRHLLCAVAMAYALVLLFTLVPHATGVAIPVTIVLRSAVFAAAARAPHAWHSAMLAVWAAGAALLLARLCAGYWRMSRTVSRSNPSDQLNEVPVAIADVPVPLITGLFRPIILLPEHASRWPSAQREAAIRHELTHLNRRDLWINLLAHLTCAVYWFHPLAWALAFRLRLEQENACDDAVLHSGFDAPVYAEALVAAARSLTLTPLIGCPMISQTSQESLRQRIARLLDRSIPRASSASTRRPAAALLAVALSVLGLINANPRLQGQSNIQVYKMSDGVTPPKVLHKVDPNYTEEARDAKIAGTMTLSVVVGADGFAHDIAIVKGLEPGLDQKAVEAIQQWQFQPGQLNGENVSVRATIEINFRLV